MPHLSALYHYPIKSCAGILSTVLTLEEKGVAGDRLMMVTDPNYCFLTQRELPRMALIQPAFNPNGCFVLLQAPRTTANPGWWKLDEANPGRRVVKVSIWNDTCEAYDYGDGAAQWLSSFLGCPCRLVIFKEEFARLTDPRFTPEPAQTRFADGYPVLVISEASLEDLNERLRQQAKPPITQWHVRANLWASGTEPYEEDTWKRIRIGEIIFEVAKPCARCSITTVNPDIGEFRSDQEPLRTLASYRTQIVPETGKRGAMFGQNLVHRATGIISTGDVIEILERKETSHA